MGWWVWWVCGVGCLWVVCGLMLWFVDLCGSHLAFLSFVFCFHLSSSTSSCQGKTWALCTTPTTATRRKPFSTTRSKGPKACTVVWWRFCCKACIWSVKSSTNAAPNAKHPPRKRNWPPWCNKDWSGPKPPFTSRPVRGVHPGDLDPS